MDDAREKKELMDLKDLREKLDSGLFSKADLHKKYKDHKLHERNAHLLLQVIPKSKSQEKELEALQKESLKAMVDELKRYCHDDEHRLRKEFEQHVLAVFTRDKVQTKTNLLLFLADEIQEKVTVEAANIAKGDSLWIQEFLLKDLRVPI